MLTGLRSDRLWWSGNSIAARLMLNEPLLRELGQGPRHCFTSRADHVGQELVGQGNVEQEPFGADLPMRACELDELLSNAVGVAGAAELREALAAFPKRGFDALDEGSGRGRYLQEAPLDAGRDQCHPRIGEGYECLVGSRREEDGA